MVTPSSRRPTKSKKAGDSLSAKAERAAKIANVLAQHYGDVTCALHHESPFQLLVATILSAQCTDERVNATTPELFRQFPTPQKLAEASQEDVEKIIRPLGFFRAKATNIRGMAKTLMERHRGEIPNSLEELVELPGVGRKTANVVLGTAFGIPTGVVVDTHVRRITNLLGLVESKDPVKIEQQLMALLPDSEWIDFSHRLIHHGRRICVARRPQCANCPLLSLCPRVGLPPLET